MIRNKVYLVSFEYFPISQGGLARHATEIINRLIRTDLTYEAIVATPKGRKIKFNDRIKTISCFFYKNKYLGYIEFALRLCFRYQRDFRVYKVVFFSSFSYLFNPLLSKKFYLFITNTTKRVFLTNYPEETWLERLVRKITYFFLFHWENHMSKKAIKIFRYKRFNQERHY